MAQEKGGLDRVEFSEQKILSALYPLQNDAINPKKR